MNIYNVNTQEYFNGSEFHSIVDYIRQLKSIRSDALLTKHQGYVINHRDHHDNDLTFYMATRNVPYYDILCETLLHKDSRGYFDIEEYTYQVNCFAKTVFHRLQWFRYDDTNVDEFLVFVRDEWKAQQPGSRFDDLEVIANAMWDRWDLVDYHKEFIYNDQYKFVTVEEVRELFDQLVAYGLLASSDTDLYQVYEGLTLEQARTDMKTRWYSNVLTSIDKLHIESTYKAKILPLLNSITSPLNIIPSDGGNFEGKWLLHKLGGKVWFIPQYLLFYNNSK